MTVHAVMTTPQAHGGRLVPTEGKTLPLTRTALRVEAAAGLGRAVLEQTFTNPHAEPLSVTYKMPLPADAAVSGFAFSIGDRRIVGEVDKKRAARERFEEAVLEGRSAALLEEETSALFTQEIGNIPPGAEIVAEITLDQPLSFLSEGAWEFRFPLAAAPRYLGSQAASLGDVAIDVASGSVAARASLSMTIADELAPGRSPESPTHPLQCRSKGAGFEVELGGGNLAALDRDVVVRWPVTRPAPSLAVATSRPGSKSERASRSQYALVTVVPPSPDAKVPAVKRDLTLLIDTSGSMQGEPLAQAKRVAATLVESLSDGDSLEMIEFGSTARAFKPRPEPATMPRKTEALRWIAALVASGGTEMLSGVQAALHDLRPDAQRQIVLLTDGLIGFERNIVSELLKRLPRSSRFHALGVGSAANRALLMPVARAGRGIEAMIGIGEDPERAAARLLSRMRAPVVVDLAVSGSALAGQVPSRLPDLFEEAPARISLELKPEGGEIELTGRMADGAYVRRIRVEPLTAGTGNEAVAKLFARESVEDLELRIAGGESSSALDHEIESIGVAFQISSRLTSWVATTTDRTVDPRDPTRKEAMPQALPFGMSAEGLGLVPSGQHGMLAAQTRSYGMHAYAVASPMPAGAPPPPMSGSAGGMGGALGRSAPFPPAPGRPAPPMIGKAKAPAPAQAGERQREGGRADLSPPAESTLRPQAPAAAKPSDAPASRSKSEAYDEGFSSDEESDKAKGGLLQKVADTFRGVFLPAPESKADPSAALPARSAKKEVAADASVLKPTLEGRIALAKGRRVVVEITVPDGGLELELEGAVVTIEIGGRTVTGRLEASQSTREGSHAGGQIVRLVLSVDVDIADEEAVEVAIELGALRVTAAR